MIGTAVSHGGWRGPWRLLSRNSVFSGAPYYPPSLGHGAEDPFLWHTRRGFHMLMHNFVVS